jgi:hypothetical protein
VLEAAVKRYQGRLGGRAWSLGGISGGPVLSDELLGGTLTDKVRSLAAELGPAWETGRGLSPGDIPDALGAESPTASRKSPPWRVRWTVVAWLLRQLSQVRWSQ